jgi:hypothetical protein
MKPKPENFVKIANIRFPIIMEKQPKHDDVVVNGVIRLEEGTIVIEKDLSPCKMLEVFLHECIHGIDEQYGVVGLDEKQTQQFAIGLAQVLIDNPETMMRFLNPCIEGD